MSDLPEHPPQDLTPPVEEAVPYSLAPQPFVVEENHLPSYYQSDNGLLFQHYIRPSRERIPHMGHLGILFVLGLISLGVAAFLAHIALTHHLFGVTTLQQAANEIHYTLGTEAVFYLLSLAACLIVFPLFWRKSFFAGLQWRGDRAVQRAGYLIGAAVLCFILAMFDGALLPGPADAPIDRIFRMPGAAWILFAFGVTLAPFFEELGFRGFLLPALSTAYDWIAEKAGRQIQPELDANGHPQWTLPAMITASILTSILFAFLHADQTGYSIGPFLLLVCVSLVLCAARLRLRSLAASVLIHATYNFLLFSFMLIGTGGFKHLDKM
jgi:membrane protease YdiL (CAAX protease family)